MGLDIILKPEIKKKKSVKLLFIILGIVATLVEYK